MQPFASAHQNQIPRYTNDNDLSYLTDNMSLHNASPPSSISGGQSLEHNSQQSPTPAYNRLDRTASRYAMADNSSGTQNGTTKNAQPYPMEGRFDNSFSGASGVASPWATNTVSNIANANLHATDNNNFATPMVNTLAQAVAIQQAMAQPGMQGGQFQFDPLDVPQTIITERFLQNSSCYAFYRGNGQYTRLVPLDELPPIAGMPAIIPNSNGLIVVQIPRQHHAIKIPQWALQQGPLTPGSTPSTGGSMGSGRHYDAFTQGGFVQNPGFTPSGGNYANRVVTGPGSGGMRNFSNNPAPGRRDKIYCDKWVHDGVCAFAQQGCKYKHEMPLDVATQRSLGLFHGLPSWWKREHGIEMKRTDDGEKKFGDRRGSEAERHRESIRESLRGTPAGLGGGLSSWRLPVEKRASASNLALSQNVPCAGGLFGNIGCRTSSTSKGPTPLSNSYSILDVEDIISPVSSNGINNNGGIAASIHAPYSPTHTANGNVTGQNKLQGKAETNGSGGHRAFSSQEGN